MAGAAQGWLGDRGRPLQAAAAAVGWALPAAQAWRGTGPHGGSAAHSCTMRRRHAVSALRTRLQDHSDNKIYASKTWPLPLPRGWPLPGSKRPIRPSPVSIDGVRQRPVRQVSRGKGVWLEKASEGPLQLCSETHSDARSPSGRGDVSLSAAPTLGKRQSCRRGWGRGLQGRSARRRGWREIRRQPRAEAGRHLGVFPGGQ